MSLQAKQGEELMVIPLFLQKMEQLADSAGGEAPKPPRPDTAFLDDIRLTAGNEQLLSIYNQRDRLKQAMDAWLDLSSRIEKRQPSWYTLKRLADHAGGKWMTTGTSLNRNNVMSFVSVSN